MICSRKGQINAYLSLINDLYWFLIMKLYEKLVEQLSQEINQGLFAAGEKLPSIRDMSKQAEVSVTTVQEAYRRLEEQGYVESRPKSGYFVCARLEPAELPQEIRLPQRPLEISQWEHVLANLGADNTSNLFSLGHAMPDLKSASLKPLLGSWSDQAKHLDFRCLEYDSLRGTLELRQQIARIAAASNTVLHPEEIIVTTGCQEALNSAFQAILKPGDVIAVDSPCFYGALQAIKASGAKVMEIPTHPEQGISLEALELALEQWPIKAIMVTPTCNNPLGFSMSSERKRGLYQLAQRYDIALIEDDIYGDLAYSYPRPTTIKSLDTDGRVVLCSSFSKTLAPGLRVGWIAPGRYRDEVVQRKYVSTASTSTLPQLVIARFIAEGYYERHLRRMRAQYQRQRDQMIDWIKRNFPPDIRISYPQGGYILWLELGADIDCVELNRRIQGFRLASGVLFSATGKYRNCIRLNYACALDDTYTQALLAVADEVMTMRAENSRIEQSGKDQRGTVRA